MNRLAKSGPVFYPVLFKLDCLWLVQANMAGTRRRVFEFDKPENDTGNR